MINTIVKNENNHKLAVETFLNDIYLLPKWEIIKSFSLTKKRLFFMAQSFNVDLYRKFSAKHQLEKYSIRTKDEKVLANMDLKIYKDSVYIINLEIESQLNIEELADNLLQVAAEKALYNTTKKEVILNLTSNSTSNGKIRKIIINKEFEQEVSQSEYEKKMFGETFSLKVDNSMTWTRKIKQLPILINK